MCLINLGQFVIFDKLLRFNIYGSEIVKFRKEETAKEKATPADDTKDKQADDEKEEEIVKGWKTRSRGGGSGERIQIQHFKALN